MTKLSYCFEIWQAFCQESGTFPSHPNLPPPSPPPDLSTNLAISELVRNLTIKELYVIKNEPQYLPIPWQDTFIHRACQCEWCHVVHHLKPLCFHCYGHVISFTGFIWLIYAWFSLWRPQSHWWNHEGYGRNPLRPNQNKAFEINRLLSS